MDIAKRVKERRTALGLTQYQLADLVGTAQTSIQKIERGDTKNPRNIEALARLLLVQVALGSLGICTNGWHDFPNAKCTAHAV